MRLTLDAVGFDETCEQLGLQIQDHCLRTGTVIDKMIQLPRGASRVADVVCRMLDLDALAMEAYAIKTRAADHSIQPVEVGQKPAKDALKGRVGIVIDDVLDSATTMLYVLNDLKANYEMAGVYVAVPYFKPDNNLYGIVPDFFVEAVSGDTWIDFPGERFDQSGNEFRNKLQGHFNKNGSGIFVPAGVDL